MKLQVHAECFLRSWFQHAFQDDTFPGYAVWNSTSTGTKNLPYVHLSLNLVAQQRTISLHVKYTWKSP